MQNFVIDTRRHSSYCKRRTRCRRQDSWRTLELRHRRRYSVFPILIFAVIVNIFVADVKILRLCEAGSLAVSCRSLMGKMINGKQVSIRAADSVNIEAMYTQAAHINAFRNITTSLLRGYIHVLVFMLPSVPWLTVM